MKRILLFVCAAFFCIPAFADTISVDHFAIVENPFAENEVAVQATDTAGHVQEGVNGTFTFTMNGFQEVLQFDKGTAFYRHKIDKSTFLYAKHQNDSGTHATLYYVYKNGSKLRAWHISWMWLVAIPCALILLAYMFKRFIIIAVIIFIIFLYFNHSNGLSIGRFFESIVDGLKGLFL